MTSVLVLYSVQLILLHLQENQGASFIISHGSSHHGNKTVSPAFRYFDLKTGASNHNLDFYKEDVNETAENK